jgi:hypothetical protein
MFKILFLKIDSKFENLFIKMFKILFLKIDSKFEN